MLSATLHRCAEGFSRQAPAAHHGGTRRNCAVGHACFLHLCQFCRLALGSTVQPPSTRPRATPADFHALGTLGPVSQGWLDQGALCGSWQASWQLNTGKGPPPAEVSGIAVQGVPIDVEPLVQIPTLLQQEWRAGGGVLGGTSSRRGLKKACAPLAAPALCDGPRQALRTGSLRRAEAGTPRRRARGVDKPSCKQG